MNEINLAKQIYFKMYYNSELLQSLPTLPNDDTYPDEDVGEFKIDLPNMRCHLRWQRKPKQLTDKFGVPQLKTNGEPILGKGKAICIWSILVLQEDGTTRWERLPVGLKSIKELDNIPEEKREPTDKNFGRMLED